MQRVLVTGATGNVGRPTLQALGALGIPAIAARSPGSTVPTEGASVVLDFLNPATFGPALDGVDGLFLLRPPAISNMGPTLNALVDAGRGRLRRVVFLSVAGAEKNSFIPHAAVERHLMAGPTPYTLLRAGFFAQNLTGPYLRDIRDHDRLYVPAGAGRASWVDARDLGEAAARAFLEPEAPSTAWTLTGPETASFAEVAAMLSEGLGRPVLYQRASLPAYLLHLRRSGLPWSQAIVYAALHLAVRFGAEDRVDPTLARVLGRRPRAIRESVQDMLPQFARG
jgi:uncharacterized protein YbjT (DUF2867 family)